jgi:phage portal protein BeeE
MRLNPFRRRDEPQALSEAELLDLAFGFRSIGSAFNVTQDNAIKSTAVVACLIVRAETFASLPVHVYRQDGDSRHKVPGHPLDLVIGQEANPLMTSVEFWRWKQLTEDIRGHAFVRIERSGGKPIAFWPMTNRNISMRDRKSVV